MANKPLFELELKNEPLTTDKLALGKSGSSYKNITAANLSDWIIARIPPPPAVRPTRGSGRPNLAWSAAMIMSHARAVSKPPPRA